MKTLDRRRTGSPPSAANGPTGPYFGVWCYRRSTFGASPTTFLTVSLRCWVNKGQKRKGRGCQTLARDGTQLLLQASLVYVHPTFGYLVFGNAEEAHPGKGHVSAGRCDAHELALVGTVTLPAYYHLVCFGHYLLYGIFDVWEGGAVNADVVLELFDAPPLLLAGQVVEELSA